MRCRFCNKPVRKAFCCRERYREERVIIPQYKKKRNKKTTR